MSLICKLWYFTKTYTGLLLNYFSFVPNCYKLGLIKTLAYQMYRINNSKSKESSKYSAEESAPT